MKKIVVRVLKVLAGVLAVVVVLTVVAGFLLNTSKVQNRLLDHSVKILSEKLDTKVEIDSISIDVFAQYLQLWDVRIEDREQRDMLVMERLAVRMDLMPLLENEVKISSAKIEGLKAMLYKSSPDEPANYQFLIDAFKKDRHPDEQVKKEKKGKKLSFDVDDLTLDRISVSYNDAEAQLLQVLYKKNLLGSMEGKLVGLDVKWVGHTKKGDQDCQAGIAQILYKEKGEKHQFTIGNLYFKNDNHLPRKNVMKPKRGAFDNGHMDFSANLQVTATMQDKKSLKATIDRCEVTDKTAGIHVKNLKLDADLDSLQKLNLKNIEVSLDNTIINIASAEMQLPSKKRGVGLFYSTSEITGKVLLKDIAAPFAPVLSKFSIPITLSAKMKGDDNSMSFSDVVVETTDKKLQVKAEGRINELKDKYKLNVHFKVPSMYAKGDIKEQIINQFPVKKFMMKQLRAIGNISYQGDFFVFWKQERFRGLLSTGVGKINFDFSLDENNKYVMGKLSTKKVDLGQAFDMNDLGDVACNADFKFDISKPRTALMRKQKGGKLPIGTVQAKVDEVSYKKVKVKNLQADIESDGAVATGMITIKNRYTDVLCSFSFTSTDSIKSKLKVKPGIKFHKQTEEDKKARAEAKQQKKKEKAERKAQKAEERAKKKAAKKAAKEAAKQGKLRKNK